MDLNTYILQEYDGKANWFQEETSNVYHMDRINKVLDIKGYLSGNHAILNRPNEVWNGKTIIPQKIILQYAKTLINFSTAYLLGNPCTLAGDEKAVGVFKEIYKNCNYDKVNFDLLDKMNKYGLVAEYVYTGDDGIKSRVIPPEDSYPIYSDSLDYLGFIEYWANTNNISTWIVYYPERVEKYSNEGGYLHLVDTWTNASGLPVVYKNLNEIDDTAGRSDLEDYIDILDALELLISTYFDGIYKFINPIGVVVGSKLSTGKNNEGAISPNIAGFALQLEEGSSFDFVAGKLDYKSFETVYKTLKQALLDISCTPGVSMNSQEISNLSEVSIKLLFSLADLKAKINEQYIKAGFIDRHKQIAKILSSQGVDVNANDIEVVFQYARPTNDKDIIDMLQELRNIGGISLQSVLENSPFTKDVKQEMKRIQGEKTEEDKTSINTEEREQNTTKTLGIEQ